MKYILIFFIFPGLLAADLQNDLEVIYERRLEELVTSNYDLTLAARWQNEITEQGIWNDVDYASGCDARRATWPAQDHWHRIITMATAWHYNQSDQNLFDKINLALNWWFDRDFTEPDCINGGGRDNLNCPCGTPGMWNTNWYGQMILIPGLVGNACIIMKTHLFSSQLNSCRTVISRAYARIDGDPNGSMGAMTGANMLDVSSRGINLAILSNDTSLLNDAINRYFNECQYTPGSKDGVKVDGTFMQHDAQIYNGNYGADFMRTMIVMFYQTKNTSFYPPESVQEAFLTVINGSEWFIYRKNSDDDPLSPILSWQYSVMGRMISHKYSDWHGINGIKLDILLSGTETWGNRASFQEIVGRLHSGSNVNPGGLVGTRFFPISDYMVHRGADYIVTLKMFSTRTTNSECNNSQNPYGFHLSDGVIYTYKNGHEYTDIYAAWDWYLIPGSTVDYGATPLACNRVQFKGKENFVGGVALGNAGVAVMNYTNPQTESLHWLKSYFFFPSAYVVQFVGDVITTSSSPIYTTLDQRQLSGPVYIDGILMTGTRVNTIARKVWHDGVGYEFVQPVNLTVDTNEKQADWPAIGISLGNEMHSIFAAYFTHTTASGSGSPYDYIAFINVDVSVFNNDARQFSSVQLLDRNSFGIMTQANVRGAAFGDAEVISSDRYISLAFLSAGEFSTHLEDITAVATNAPVVLQFHRDNDKWKIAVADPSHLLNTVQINVTLANVADPIVLAFELPRGNWAGSAAQAEFGKPDSSNGVSKTISVSFLQLAFLSLFYLRALM